MMSTPFIPPSLVVIGLLLAIFIFVASKNHKESGSIEPNYMAFFILGICLFVVGIILWYVMNNLAFLGIAILGFVNLVISLAHTDKWKA